MTILLFLLEYIAVTKVSPSKWNKNPYQLNITLQAAFFSLFLLIVRLHWMCAALNQNLYICKIVVYLC